MKRRTISLLLVFALLCALLPAGLLPVSAAETTVQEPVALREPEESPTIARGRENIPETIPDSEPEYMEVAAPTFLQTTAEEEIPVVGDNEVVPRSTWIQMLVATFDMVVEEAHAPDNYFCDLTGEESYYRDILVAVQFGIVDIPAGEAFVPEEAASREFAAQTLNACLGFQLDENASYTFSEAPEVTYPSAIQVAINRGWFPLSSGKFLPQKAVTGSDAARMLADAEAVLEARIVDLNYQNSYEFSADVIEVPQGTEIEILSDTVTIYNCPVAIKTGNVFIVWYRGVPCAYVANSISKNGNETKIIVTAIEDDSAIISADAQGLLNTEFVQFVPAEGTEVVYVDEVTGTEYTDAAQADAAIASHHAERGTKKLMTLQLKSEVDLGNGLTASVSVKLKDPVLEYKFSSANKTASVILTADYEFSLSAKAELIETAAVKKLRLGFWGAPGIGGIELAMVYSLAGSITGTFSGTMSVGMDYTSGAGFSIPRSFHSKGFSLVLEASLKAGLQVNLGINDVPLNLVSGYVYVEVGAKGSVKRTSYDEGTPKVCLQTAMYLYLECGAKLSFKVGPYKSEFSKEYKIWKDSNSPVRVVHHYEDGKEVCECTRGNVDANNGYYTVGSSNYWGSGWSGGSGSTGYDRDGNPVVVYTYTLDENNNATITGYNGGGAAINIPEKIDGYTVTAIGVDVFKNKIQLSSVNFPDSLIFIGEDAFYGCTGITKITLPQKLVKLGGGAFGGCTSLQYVYIPKSLESCGTSWHSSNYVGPFGYDAALTNVEFETGITTIPGYLFYYCTGLKTIVIPETVTKIGSDAFGYCASLEQIELPEKLTKVGEAAFNNCTSLKYADLSDSIAEISDEMFYGCTALDSIHLPDSVTIIRLDAFNGCDLLQEVTGGKNVKEIFSNAFSNCASLKEIKLQSNCVEVGNYAFHNCTALAKVEIADSVTSIGSYIFDGCSSLTNVKLGTGITEIPNYAFSNCSALESIEIPYRVTEIGKNAFLNDVKLTSVTIPRRTTTIATNAFSYPDILTIYGVAGTTAETYAAEIGAKFVAIDVPATAVSLNHTQLTMSKGASATLIASITPSNFTDEVAWKSSNTSVATVTDDGVVKAVGIGECTISFVAGNVKATCKVIVVQPVTSISLNKTSLSLDAGTTYTLTATVNPSNAANKTIVWSSDNEKVATVDQNGVVTAISKGTATITVAAQDGSGVTRTCKVTVLNNLYVVNKVADLQSPHPYATNANDVWQYSISGATALEVTFSSETSVEEGSDYIYIYSEDGTLVGTYTGTALAGKTVTVQGETVKIKLVSDGTYCEYGFAVTSVKAVGEGHTHSYAETVIAPTCTKRGYTLHTCSCGDSYQDHYTNALGHQYVNGVCIRCGAEEPKEPVSNPFADVGESQYYYAPILWAVEQGITNGTTPTTFSPENPCTRGQIVTFLWRAFGSPEPKSSRNPFSDVPANVYYYKAILWAVEQGITTGTSATTFSPEATCTRGQVATFLWRACGKPAPKGSGSPFSDVPKTVYYYEPILWAVEQGITNGTGNGQFSPEASCTRGQIVTFLYRALEE